MLFPDQEKLLNKVVFGLAVSEKPTCTIYTSGKTSENDQELKVIFSNMPL